MAKPPKIKFAEIEPLQDYFSDGNGNQYSVAMLIDDAKDLPVFDVPLAAIDLSGEIWQGCDMHSLAFHCKKVMDADLSHPIILDNRGRIADGRHRVMRAIIEGRRTIKAKRIMWRLDPARKV